MAPDLLEALEEMVRWFGNPKREEWLNDAAFQEAKKVDEQAREAIAKAKLARTPERLRGGGG